MQCPGTNNGNTSIMSTDDFNKKLDNQIALITKENKPFFLAVKSIMAVQSKRIWIDGKNKEGANIGEYQNSPDIYISPKAIIKGATKPLPGFPLKGKTGKTEFKNGKKHKTGYFKSYPDFKKSIGRNQKVKTVDLFLTGTVASDWANADTTAQANATKINVNNYQVGLNDLSLKKVDKYNGANNLVFGLSVKEKALFLDVVETELGKLLQ